MAARSTDARIGTLVVTPLTIPTSQPESDGTLEWRATTIVIVEIGAGGETGIGYTYAGTATATFIRDTLEPAIHGQNAFDIAARWHDMVAAIRNHGRPGVASMAIAAVDTALWDLKARLLNLPLVALLDSVRESVPAYGSGGFTSYTIDELCDQLAGWVGAGLTRVKMKVGRDAPADRARVAAAREAIGPQAALFVDANGAYDRKQALAQADAFAGAGVSWFEEPVSSDDLAGLRLIRDRAPAGMVIAAGEYGYDLPYFRRMLEAGAVDCLQADLTRCAGITGFLRVGALAAAYGLPLSTHTAPSLHAHVACATASVRHAEYFHDHARIETMLFDGALTPADGRLRPDRTRPGLGLHLKRADTARFTA